MIIMCMCVCEYWGGGGGEVNCLTNHKVLSPSLYYQQKYLEMVIEVVQITDVGSDFVIANIRIISLFEAHNIKTII